MTRSFTWQLRHQLAVKSINTGRPCARYFSTSAGENGSHCELLTVLTCAEAVLSLRTETIGIATAHIRTITAQAVAGPFAGQRPRIHPATTSSRNAASRAASALI